MNSLRLEFEDITEHNMHHAGCDPMNLSAFACSSCLQSNAIANAIFVLAIRGQKTTENIADVIK